MEKPEISVVVPVYNVEEYLEHCVNSILSQTYRDFELILVDDGSTDKSGILCDQLAKTDERIIVYHQENGGLSVARNTGVAFSKGKYIAFIDSDDYVASNYLGYLREIMHKGRTRMSCCRCIVSTDTGYEFDRIGKLEFQVLSGVEACKNEKISLIACCTLCEASIIKKYPFPVGRIHEDVATTCKFMYDSGGVAVGKAELYLHYNRPTSLNHKKDIQSMLDEIWVFTERACFFEEHDSEELKKIAWHDLSKRIVGFSLEQPNNRKLWREYYLQLMKSKVHMPKIKMQSFFAMHIPKIYRIYQKKIKK